MGHTSSSALYVVDLVKFRETAAGDNLRVFYETLSKDPNSLSNLDQASHHFHDHQYHLLLSVPLIIIQYISFINFTSFVNSPCSILTQ